MLLERVGKRRIVPNEDPQQRLAVERNLVGCKAVSERATIAAPDAMDVQI